MNSRTRRWLLAAGIVLLAGLLRVPRLAERPMHADEAILADKLGTLLEDGVYNYDPSGYHGPALPYTTLLSARFAGANSLAELDESVLRSVSVAAGIALVLLPLLLVPGLGWPAAVSASALVAVSPSLAFYSRYYIPEALFAAASFGVIVCANRYSRRPAAAWMIGAGALAGLAYASKETWIVVFASLLAALLAATPPALLKRSLRPRHVLLGVGAFLLVGGLLYSSFLANPSGIPDSFASLLKTYAPKALHDEFHTYPWHFYWQRWLFFREAPGPLWSEAAVFVLAIIGGVSTMLGRVPENVSLPLARFLAWYALLVSACYTVIPYKTPWSFLGPIHAMVLVAGIGAYTLISRQPRGLRRALLALALAAFSVNLAVQAFLLNYRYSSDPRNPWVYAHTTTDVYRVRKALDALARAHPAGRGVPVQVVSSGNVWPLPWYLRQFENVEWWTGVSPEFTPAPVILATPEMEEPLSRRIYDRQPPGQKELYLPLFDSQLELRPGVELRGYLAKRLWDARNASSGRP
jgi:uncharacterized protein (TIGR03663 family)